VEDVLGLYRVGTAHLLAEGARLHAELAGDVGPRQAVLLGMLVESEGELMLEERDGASARLPVAAVPLRRSLGGGLDHTEGLRPHEQLAWREASHRVRPLPGPQRDERVRHLARIPGWPAAASYDSDRSRGRVGERGHRCC
jgi:hypothetical protein